MSGLFDILTNPQMLLAAFVAIGVAATVLTVALPLLERDQLSTRMMAVALER